MTSMPCQSAALGRIIAPWAATIAEFFGIIVEIILANAENVRTILHELGACCRKAAPRAAVGAAYPMMAKLAPGWRATGRASCCLRRARSVRLPASPPAEFRRAVMMNLRGKSEARSPRPQLPSSKVLLAEIGGGAGADLSPRKELRRFGADW
jgi:hypothetical protein